jgi:hypothetical protein
MNSTIEKESERKILSIYDCHMLLLSHDTHVNRQRTRKILGELFLIVVCRYFQRKIKSIEIGVLLLTIDVEYSMVVLD